MPAARCHHKMEQYFLHARIADWAETCAGAFATEHDLPATLTVLQRGLIENVFTLLAPFKELTKEISSSTATAADVIPAITVLKRLLEKRAETDFGVGTTKATLLEAVQRRFSDVEKEPLYTLATVLAPRLVGYLLIHLFIYLFSLFY